MVAAVEHFRREAAEADSSFRIRIERADPMIAALAGTPDGEGVREERSVGPTNVRSGQRRRRVPLYSCSNTSGPSLARSDGPAGPVDWAEAAWWSEPRADVAFGASVCFFAPEGRSMTAEFLHLYGTPQPSPEDRT